MCSRPASIAQCLLRHRCGRMRAPFGERRLHAFACSEGIGDVIARLRCVAAG